MMSSPSPLVTSGLGGEEGTLEVRVHNGVPARLVDVKDSLWDVQTGIIHQAVQSSEFGGNAIDTHPHRGDVGDVHENGHRTQPLRHLCSGPRLAARAGDRRAGLLKRVGDHGSQTTTRAGDQSDLSVEPEREAHRHPHSSCTSQRGRPSPTKISSLRPR